VTPSSSMPPDLPPAAGDGAAAIIATGGDRRRAGVVADAVAQAAAASGVALDDGLLIWSLAGAPPASLVATRPHTPLGAAAAGALDPVDLVGAALEAATDGERRRAQGLHVTPRWLAEHLVTLALPSPPPRPAGDAAWPTVCDPACGGGVFLVAAARLLHGRGVGRRHVVRHLLWGADIDPLGLAAAEAALALWAGEPPPPGRLVVGDPLGHGRAVWPDPPPDGFDAVVGNPPFQSQLGRATARSAADQRRLRARFGSPVRAYTDTAWLFLLVGCELVRPGGRVVLVEPQSLVAARDAAAVRAAVDRHAVLRDLWLDEGRVFRAAVRVCAPVLELRADGASQPDPPAVSAAVRASADGPTSDGDDRWGTLWALALDLPALRVDSRHTLGERATVVAGFRDEYYGLVDLVRELDPSDRADAVAPLVTSGALDWAACAWGDRPIRFAKRRWRAPVVDRSRLATVAPRAARRWVERTRVPKLVVATQTRVVEAAVDHEGAWVPSVPALAVVPADPDDMWRLAAALLSPAATAWLARRAAGTGLERGALKVAGPDLAALPLPADQACWDAAALALRGLVAAPGPAALDAYLVAIAQAYGVPGSLTAWWRGRAGTAVRHGSLPG
jgi:hypothetical protein